MFETFSYSSPCSILAKPEPLRNLVPIPVFRRGVDVELSGVEPVEVAILQELAEIKREVRALWVRGAAKNGSAVPLESAMAMLGCKRSQIFRLLEQRRLERAPKVGRSVMITAASIEALFAEGSPRKGNSGARSKSRRARATKASPVAPVSEPEARELGAAILKLPI